MPPIEQTFNLYHNKPYKKGAITIKGAKTLVDYSKNGTSTTLKHHQ
jgi:hypothetical protein